MILLIKYRCIIDHSKIINDLIFYSCDINIPYEPLLCCYNNNNTNIFSIN